MTQATFASGVVVSVKDTIFIQAQCPASIIEANYYGTKLECPIGIVTLQLSLAMY